jgi:hypothetical protein
MDLKERIVVRLFCGLVVVGLMVGCNNRPGVFPNSDPALTKKPAEFSADAANRHPMKTNLPDAGPADGIARIDYTIEFIQLTNLSDTDWTNVEVWVNKKYVVFVPKIEAGKLRTLFFGMFYDGRGHTIPPAVDNQPRIQSVQMLRNGAWYDVPMVLAK